MTVNEFNERFNELYELHKEEFPKPEWWYEDIAKAQEKLIREYIEKLAKQNEDINEIN